MLGYNSDHEAAAKAKTELADKYGVQSVTVQVQRLHSCDPMRSIMTCVSSGIVSTLILDSHYIMPC